MNAAAGSAFDTGLIAAQVGYMNSTAPLLTSATQSFNAAFVQAYAAAVGNDPDQVAVAGAWQAYEDSLAGGYQTLLTSAASAFQQAGDSVATAAQTLANQLAAEGVTEAGSIASAWTTFVGNVAPAAKTLAYSEADAEQTFVQTVANNAQTADDQDADAAKTFSDTAVDEGQTYEDDVTDAAQTFLQAVADADKPRQAALINNARAAAQQDNTAVTQLAQGAVDEQDDLNKDALNEGKAAATQAVDLRTAVLQAFANKDAAAGTLSAAEEYNRRAQMPSTNWNCLGGGVPREQAPFALAIPGPHNVNWDDTLTLIGGVGQFTPRFPAVGSSSEGKPYQQTRGAILEATTSESFANSPWGGPIYDRSYEIQRILESEFSDIANVGEAARHLAWQALNTYTFGPNRATLIGDIHERGSNRVWDSARDQYNNVIGRQIGEQLLKEFPKTSNHLGRFNANVREERRQARLVELIREAIASGEPVFNLNDPRIRNPE